MQQQQNVCPQHLLNLPHSCAKACRISGLAHSAQHTGMQHRQSVQNVTLHPIVSANRPLPLESKAQVKDQSSELPDIVRSFMAPMTIKSTPTTSKRVVEDGGLVKRYDWGFSMSLLICSSFQTFHYFCRQTYIHIYINVPKTDPFLGSLSFFPTKRKPVGQISWTIFQGPKNTVGILSPSFEGSEKPKTIATANAFLLQARPAAWSGAISSYRVFSARVLPPKWMSVTRTKIATWRPIVWGNSIN